MTQPMMKTQKQNILLWFRFLQLCHRDSTYKTNLKKSSNFYKEWGDVRDVKFDVWWKDHKHLFGSTRVNEVSRVSRSPNTITVEIPLNQPVSRSMKELKELITTKQVERIKDLGLTTRGMKTKSVSFGKFETTKGVEIRGKTLYEILLMMEIYIDLGCPRVGTDFVDEVISRMKSRPRSKWIPYLLHSPKSLNKKGTKMVFPEETLDQVRRYIRRGKTILENVSNGEFPGRQTLK